MRPDVRHPLHMPASLTHRVISTVLLAAILAGATACLVTATSPAAQIDREAATIAEAAVHAAAAAAEAAQ